MTRLRKRFFVCLFLLGFFVGARASEPGYRHLNRIGGNGQAAGHFIHPACLVCDDAGNIHVTDFGNKRVQIFAADGRFIRDFPVRPRLARPRYGPLGLAVGQDGCLFVVDQDHHQVKCFERDGSLRSSFGRQGSWRKRFRSPRGLAVDRNDTLYVADSDNYRVQKFTAGGEYLGEIRYRDIHTQRFARPWGLAVRRDGAVAVAYPEIRRVVLFDAEGKVQHEFPGDGSLPVKLVTPRYLVFDNLDRLFITDFGSGRVLLLDRRWSFLGSFGQEGPSDERLQQPEGVAVDFSGRVLVADAGNDYIQIFEPTEKVRRRNWAAVYQRQGRFGRAVEEWEQIVHMEPDSAEFRQNLLQVLVLYGQQLIRQEKLPAARTVFERIRQIDPLNAYAIRELKRIDALPVQGQRRQIRHLLIIFLLALGLALSFLMSFTDSRRTRSPSAQEAQIGPEEPPEQA